MAEKNITLYHTTSLRSPPLFSSNDKGIPKRSKTLSGLGSLTSLLSKFHPSNRPERGGTNPQTYQAHQKHRGGDSSNVQLARTDTRPSAGSFDAQNSDTIPASQWRTPISVPPRTQSVRGKTAGTNIGILRAEYSSRHESEELVTTPMLGAPIMRATSNPFPRRKPLPQDMDGAREMFLAKQEARRLRRTLKENGDFLGVTGVNPTTGEMDVLTPTSSSEEHQAELSAEQTNLQLTALARRAQHTREEYEAARREADMRLQRDRREKAERNKEAIRLTQQPVKWRREEGQWSSVAEPGLSPIAQSKTNTPEEQSPRTASEATTIHRSPDSFLGVGPLLVPEAGSAKEPLLSDDGDPPAEQHHRESARGAVESHSDKPASLPNPSPSRMRSVRLRFPPLIPRRLGSRSSLSSMATRRSSETEEKIENTKTQKTEATVLKLDLENQSPADR
ncbi:hypothetical protein B0T14DRAFT_227303 [Immersiella caudata]|uniref:Uncharacterized protein n=1 Tax=Immersiella caudata TaxID=314043 RepID=A0AA39WRK4_9PEZI|nr:hypothetical protein B0T14DRAFT_227303 [Immersiella caudata]